MSYQSRKQKRSFRYRISIILRKFVMLFYRFKKLRKQRKEACMRYQAVTEIMRFLRERSSYVRKNNPRINEWVDGYVNQCLVTGTPVTILTQWCLSKNLERRLAEQGGVFVPTKKERLLFEKDIPEVVAVFERFGVGIEWWITFNRSFLDSRRPERRLEAVYKDTIATLAASLVSRGWLILQDWEDDILGRRSSPNSAVLVEPLRYVNADALERELAWTRDWAREETNLAQSDEELRRDVFYQIACEAEEGRILGGPESPIGKEFLLVPLEVSEQYDFFTIFVPDFKKRIVPVLPPYPWRLKEK